MQTRVNFQDISAVDTQSISEIEAKSLVLKRGRDIKAGRTKLISHDTVMHEMKQMLSSYESSKE